MPKSIGYSGFASDGAFHLEQNADFDATVTMDIDRIDPNFVLHKPFFISGEAGSETDHVIGHWKCNDDEASTTIVEELGRIGNLALYGGNDTEDITVEGAQGNALDFDGSADYAYVAMPTSGDYDPVNWLSSFSFSCRFKSPSADTGTILSLYQAWDDRFTLRGSSNNTLTLDAYIDGTSETLSTEDNSVVDDQWHSVWCGWHEGFMFLCLDGVMYTDRHTDSAFATEFTYFCFGTQRNSAISLGEFTIDEVLLLDGCILPYGSAITMAGQLGGSDYSQAHGDITCHWKAESTALEIGTGSVAVDGSFVTGLVGDCYDNESDSNNAEITVTSSDNLDPTSGQLSLLFNIQTLAANDTLLGFGTTTAYIDVITYGSSTFQLRFRYRSNGTTFSVTTTELVVQGQWNHLLIQWKESDFINIALNGVYETPVAVTEDWNGNVTDTLFICANAGGSYGMDALIDEVFITNNPNTPQAWTAFGKELWTPQIENNGTLVSLG